MGTVTTAPFFAFDVIVVGGGHAGIEAAYAAAKLGSKTALVSLDIEKIGTMPCNPSIGGVGKGHIVYEISALGGLMPELCTQTYLQARMLNTKKGPAVQGLRLQIDKYAYSNLAQSRLAKTSHLTLMQGAVTSLAFKNDMLIGVILSSGELITSKTVVITSGTFLNGLIHIGTSNYHAGRRGEKAITTLSPVLESLGIKLKRLKTGTPPRLLKSSLDFSVMELQEADSLEYLFEFKPHTVINTHACYITHTNEKTHAIIQKNLHLSAMYNGNIKGIGPRYCPSIEDKIGRFPDKKSHHIFVEPESAAVDEVYPSGLSTSLPYEIQKEYIQSIVGFENAIITKPGYAVEYDSVLPNQLTQSLEVKTVPGLFLAGQINGTTGYEEAAGQGIIAGINAHLKAHEKEPFILNRNESYIGVMIDDLTTLGTDEPYRMFTSRAERRLLLRQDNVFLRLTEKAYTLGLINSELYDAFIQEKTIIQETIKTLTTDKKKNDLLKLFSSEDFNREEIKKHLPNKISERAIDCIRAEILYAPYIIREQQEVAKSVHYQSMKIPEALFTEIIDMPGLSKELQQKIIHYKPQTIAQADLIQGMTPAALSLLIFKAKMHIKQTAL